MKIISIKLKVVESNSFKQRNEVSNPSKNYLIQHQKYCK